MNGIHIPITADYKNFTDSMNQVSKSVKSTMDEVEESGMSIEQMFNRIRNAAALSFAGFSGAKLVKDIANVRGEFQQLEVAFSTMLGSEEKAVDLMNQLVRTAAMTPFDLKGVAAGAKSLMAYGTAAEDVNETLIRLGDIAAGMSIPLNDLVYLYGTTMVQGRMFTQDLRQFQGRGIPIAEELAKVLKTTKENIPDLVTAGKVTGEVFQQAIVNMTAAGSKFGGLMEKQSKTINGQISNIQDSIDIMFNEIGKNSEGIINGALSSVSFLVENYETLGKILIDCAVAYGTYKTALMVTSAVQSAQAIGLGALTTAETVHYGWLVLVEKAQALLNKTAALNPYAMVAMALMTLVSSMVLFNHEADGMGKAIEEANSKVSKSFQEVEAQIKVEQKSIDDLFNKLRKAEKGTEEYKTVKDEILKQYGQYLKGLGNEIETLKDVEGAYRKVAAAARDAALARGKEAALSQANSDYTSKYADAMGQIYDELRKKFSENDTKRMIGWIEGDLKKTGQVAEDTQKALHKYGVSFSLFGDLNKAEQGLITSTQRINALFGDQQKQVKETSESVTSLSDDYKAAEKKFKNAKNWLAAIEKNKADYTAAEYNKAKDDLKAAKEAFEKVGGDPEGKKAKAGASYAKDLRNRSADQIQEELKYEDELRKLRQNAIDARVEADIARIKDSNERERAEQAEQHKRNLRQIEEEALEMKKAIYEHNKAVWENTHKDSPYELTNAGKAGWADIVLPKEQQQIIDARKDEEVANEERRLDELRKQQIQSYRDLLKEYGSFEEQKLAITQEYEEKIRNASTPEEKAGFEFKRDQDIQRLAEEQLSTKIDWSAVFSDLRSYSKDYLIGLRDQLQGVLNDGNLPIDQMQTIQDKLISINEEISRQGGLFGFVGDRQREHNRLVQEAEAAQQRLNEAFSKETEIVGNILSLGREAETLIGKPLEKDKNGMYVNPFEKGTPEYEKANDIIQKLTKNEIDLTKARNKTASATTEAVQAEEKSRRKASQALADWFADAQQFIAEKGIDQIPDLLNNLGLGSLGDKASKGLSAFNNAAGAAADFASGNYVGAALKAIGAVKDLGSAFGIGGGNKAEVAETTERLTEQNKKLADRVSDLTEVMEKQVGSKAVNTYEKALEAQEQINENSMEILKAQMGYHSAHHSNAYYMDDAEIRKYNAQAKSAFNAAGVKASTINGLSSIYSLTPEQLKAIKDFAPDLWNYLTTVGKYDKSEYWENVVENAGKTAELTKQIQQTLTTTTAENVFDDFMDDLYNLADGSEDVMDDIAESWQKMVNRMAINNVIGNGIQKELDEWYEQLGKVNQDLVEGKIEESEYQRRLNSLKADYDAKMKKAQDRIGQLRDLGIVQTIGEVGKEDKTASARAAEKVTYDQMDEFTGILRSMQISGEQKLDVQRQILETLMMMSRISSPDSSDIKEIRNLLGASNDYLLDIKRSNRNILDEMTDRMDKIIDKLEDL